MAGRDVEGYLRVAAMAVALYDGLSTIPAEITLYREQRSFKRMTRACILFILIRYISILVIIVSNLGFFDHSFTHASCGRYYLVSPSFKALQTMISQIIVAVRTIAVAGQARWVVFVVSTIFAISVVFEFFSNIWHRVPFQEPSDSFLANCTSGNSPGMKIAWVHYLAAMLYDAICLAVVIGYTYARSRHKWGHTLDGLSKMLLKEGLLYFLFLTGVNVFNLFLYTTDSPQAQSSGATLGYAMTWIMSQRLILCLQDFRRAAQSLDLPASNNRELPKPHFLTNANTAIGEDVELGVHVTIEENIKVDYNEDSASDVVIPHRITTARIENEYWRREGRNKRTHSVQFSRVGGIVEDRYKEQKISKGWEVTSVGKLFSP